MKSSDRMIVMVVPIVGLLLAFYMLVLGPKRNEAAELSSKVDEASAALTQTNDTISAGQAAQDAFPSAYRDLVSLGKAAPSDDDEPTLIYDFAELAKRNDLEMINFKMTGSGDDAAAAAAAAPTAPPDGTTPPAEGSTTTTSTTTTTAAAPVATESTAATLPIGAAIGPAGLPVMPYDFVFRGDFFETTDMIKDIDDQVATTDTGVDVDGRLVTIDGFSLQADPNLGFPHLEADFALTTYIVPPEQGLSAGATPAGPAATVPGSTSTVSSSSTTTPAPTATATP